ncbi:carboxylate--amine ligase/circularly permuted type 2 ATP-grasp protein [Actinocorallia sp. B10E7]|uniref:carboxylate--amine ligase/circularly permuted type 2 ATP-grasp protein n=1 Tax=Actinocorallia sp. B10E7 TaxID=3153558 RepID=UPI00325D9A6D
MGIVDENVYRLRIMLEKLESVAVGVEEEFHTVDLATRKLVPRADRLLQNLPENRFSGELQRSVVETNSRPFVRLSDLLEDLAALRRAVVSEAESFGLGVVAAGTVPIVDIDALKVTPDPRYETMLEEYQLLAREQLICGAQVHVEVEDRDLAVQIGHRVSPWMPVLLALSASSPFWLGSDSGYASYRTLLWNRWPTTGPAPAVGSAAEYDALVAQLIGTGVITDPGMIYYDVRASDHVPTVELRIPDACPRVEDVTLLAGLFRALVVTELDAIAAGRPPVPTARPELVRTLTWRAARAGLEGELVDPLEGRAKPARQVVRETLDALRPALESTGDWDLTCELAESSLRRGTSAARQRSAFATGGLEAVVDQLVSETRANTDWWPEARCSQIVSMTGDYDTSADEAIVFDGTARGPYGLVVTALDRLGAEGLAERNRQKEEVQQDLGMYFEEGRLFPVDLIPRIVASEDWEFLQAGLSQRARALERFLHDAYGPGGIVEDGVIPKELVTGAPGYREEGRFVPRDAIRCAVSGTDLVRDGAGHWFVLEDNLRVPSGLGYAMANRWLSARVVPELVRAVATPAPRRAMSVLRGALTQASRELALITSGPSDPAYYEHGLLARELDVPLVEPGDLRISDGELFTGDRRIKVLYRRIDEEDLWEAVPALRDLVASGAVLLANAPGNGLGDDKSIYAYVPQMISYYLGEHPVLDNVPTYLCREPADLEQVLDRLPELVVKPVDGYGGQGVVIGPDASPQELEAARAEILAAPDQWIGQETVAVSTHPTFADGRLEPRVVDLRAFVCLGAEPDVVPMALTRVAAHGSRIVNSSRGGGSKDTWLL